MATEMTTLAVRRSTWIKAPPERVWQEFESFERMRKWFGTGHELKKYEPKPGGQVEMYAGLASEEHPWELRFGGQIIVFDAPRELTFENMWFGSDWVAPSLITFRLTPALGGTVVELLHHALERIGPSGPEMLNGFEGGWTTQQLEALRQVVEA